MMQIERILNQHWYDRQSIILSLLLWPLSLLFRGGSAIRRFYYRVKHTLFRKRSHLPVIVVGNITVGGGGKTPIVIEVVNHLKSQGFKPAVISRGYGRKSDDLISIKLDNTAAEVGDEPLLIHKKTGVATVVHRDRVRSIQYVEQHHPECNIIVADDGLQHYNLPRDYEIIVYDESRQFGNRRLLPMGPLREPISRLDTADIRVAKRLRITGFRNASTGEIRAAETFKQESCVALAGIANPKQFYHSLQQLDLAFDVVDVPDHGALSKQQLDNFADKTILTTEKDAVKYPGTENIWIAETETTLNEQFFKDLTHFLYSIKSQAH